MTDTADPTHDLSREASDLRIATFRLARRMRTQRAVDSMSDGQFAVLAGLFVHLLTFLSHVNLPLMAGYCASKAAGHSFTQALRAEVGRAGVQVCGIYPTVVDTAMSRDLAGPKLTPAELAQAILQAIESGAEDAYPGPAAAAYELYLADPKAAERRMAARLP